MLPRFVDAPGGILVVRTHSRPPSYSPRLWLRDHAAALPSAVPCRIARLTGGACCCRKMEVGP